MQGSPAAVPIKGATSNANPAPVKTVGVEPEADKGLKTNAIGMLSSVVIGIASTAPAYSLAVTLGLVVAVAGVGLKSPAIMIVSFFPMILIASSYYYLNKADPDCGTTFSWVTRAIGPRTGWVTGWVMVAADIIVMASLAQITGTYFFLLFGLHGLASSLFWVTAVGVAFLVLMSVVTAIGIEISARLQWFLLGFEYFMLVIFSVVALVKVFSSHPAGSVRPSVSWFTPNMSLGALAGGVLLALFIYWGWDTAVSVNEETEDKSRVPGVAAIFSTLGLLFIYVLTTTASQAFHGTAYLANNSGDILSPLGTAVLGVHAGQAPDRRRAHVGDGIHADDDPAGRPDDPLHGVARRHPEDLVAGQPALPDAGRGGPPSTASSRSSGTSGSRSSARTYSPTRSRLSG